MEIKQFEDKDLAHYSYAVLSNCANEVVLIDPARDIQPYLDFAQHSGARITGVIETHPHADFVSGHLELHQKTGAVIYASALQQVDYPYQAFDEGAVLELGKIKLKSLNTPGHSPDSISIVLEHEGKDKAVFTGDTLFIGDCGRPDLRENTGNVTAKREELAGAMYHSLRNKLAVLAPEIIVYPAHGAGSLCGKALSDANHSTIGAEKMSNWSLQPMTEESFVRQLTTDQPFVPKYFGYDVSLNRTGAPDLEESIARTTVWSKAGDVVLDGKLVIVDTRKADLYKRGHLSNSINIQAGGKFETWLGSIIAPEERFYLVAGDEQSLKQLIRRSARIGYESFIKAAFVLAGAEEQQPVLDLEDFSRRPEAYTIVDVRNKAEVASQPVFAQAIHIPLPELRERAGEIPAGKPVVVHCAAGYRSAAGSSILSNAFMGKTAVYDLGEDIQAFLKPAQ